MNPTAAIIIIGNEILSGRTLDLNVRNVAQKLPLLGIKLLECRIILDDKDQIISAVNSLRKKYNYIFTTGGIGPTHDDITTKAIADAFNLPLLINDEAYLLIKNFYKSKNIELNAAREKMAYLPKDSILIYNPISGAPGFYIENVFVLAGVPYIMEAMLEQLLPKLKTGNIIKSKSLDVMTRESYIAEDFAKLQSKYPHIEMGSYPFKIDHKHGTSLVLSSSDENSLNFAYLELQQLFKEFV
jgi:molybdenum cofactor synthesis domain-containing protein